MTTRTHVDAEAEIKADRQTAEQFIAARDKLIELQADLASEEAAVASNSGRYAEAVRLHAAGGPSWGSTRDQCRAMGRRLCSRKVLA